LYSWHGAGCIAQAMMNDDQVRRFYPEYKGQFDSEDMVDPRSWSLRAYFGGRVEMIKQGVQTPKFWNYDISSAYPHILRLLPNMQRGTWNCHDASQLMTDLTESVGTGAL